VPRHALPEYLQGVPPAVKEERSRGPLAVPCRSSWQFPSLSHSAISKLDRFIATCDNAYRAAVLLTGRCIVRVIARPRLIQFWESRRHDAEIARRDLSAWYKLAKAARWANFGAVKQTFGSADQVGNCVVFDVGNNRFRLIGRVNYRRGILYVLRVMDHKGYDAKRWIDSCGCHRPLPKKPAAAGEVPPEAPRTRLRKRKR
jgi:mRNA interferase HigB